MPRKYIIANIRKLMDLGFNPNDLRRLCQAEDAFKPVYNNLGSGMSKADIIEAIIDHAERHLVMAPLLVWLEKNNPGQYALNGPYDEDVPPRKPPPPPVSDKSSWWSRPWTVILAVGTALLVVGVILFTNLDNPVEPTPEPTLAFTPTPLPPQFEITALDTLESDKNAYEVTDQLIWSQDELDQYGVSITFTIEIRPIYAGNGKYGQVIALISGDSGQPPLEKSLWNSFTKDSQPQQIHLTLPELLAVSGLGENGELPCNPFGLSEFPFQQAKLRVQVVQAAAKTQPWAIEEIVIRNTPWEVQASLAQRNDDRQVDVYVQNNGGTGEFTVRYRLVRIEEEIDTNECPESNGTSSVAEWNEPNELVRLEHGAFFTDTVTIAEPSEVGRYLVELYAVKKQNYIKFDDPNDIWEDLNTLQSPWWFGEYPSTLLIFVVPLPEFEVNAIIQAELERLANEQGLDLGLPLGNAEELTSGYGTTGWRQVFQKGEVFMHDDQAYALYGPILEHYKALGGVQSSEIGFPIFPIQTITSSSGITGTMMEFEGNSALQSPAVIYASKKGVAGTWGLMSLEHMQQGGPTGWLGLPLADEQYFQDGTIQMFEYGYIVYYHPLVDEEIDWDRPLEVVPYLASRGRLFDVDAQQFWQNTGVEVQAGDRVTIVQVGGTWTYREGITPFDANGTSDLPLQTDAIIPSELVGALVGRLGEDSDHVFTVGRWKVFQAPAEGLLYLAMNDNGYDDNAGFITVQIIVENSE